MQKNIIFCFLLIIIILSPGCFRHVHNIGTGPHTDETYEYYQWYAFWGLLPIGDAKDGGQLFFSSSPQGDDPTKRPVAQTTSVSEDTTPPTGASSMPKTPPPQCVNCRITTGFQALDCLINFFTFPVSIYRTTVTIDK